MLHLRAVFKHADHSRRLAIRPVASTSANVPGEDAMMRGANAYPMFSARSHP